STTSGPSRSSSAAGRAGRCRTSSSRRRRSPGPRCSSRRRWSTPRSSRGSRYSDGAEPASAGFLRRRRPPREPLRVFFFGLRAAGPPVWVFPPRVGPLAPVRRGGSARGPLPLFAAGPGVGAVALRPPAVRPGGGGSGLLLPAPPATGAPAGLLLGLLGFGL